MKEGRKEGRMDGWMISGQATVFCWVPVAKLTMVVRLLQFAVF
jgi:hypothetical protein